MASFVTSKAGPRSRRAATVLSVGLVLLALAALPFARVRLPEITPFLPIYTTLAWTGEILTAYLLFTQARISRQAPLAVLGAGYLYNAFVIVPHIATFPGVFSPTGMLGGHPQSAIWLWALWHGGFPLWVMAYVFVERVISPVRRQTWSKMPAVATFPLLALACAAVAALLATVAVRSLPILIDHGDYSHGFRSGIFIAVVLFNLGALFATMFLLPEKTVIQVWLVVAVVCFCGDVGLTLFSVYRFSLGWYLARCLSIVAAGTIFIVFLSEVNVIYRRLAEQATIDGLTGVGNRRLFDERLSAAGHDYARNGRPLSIILLDIDDFKKFNDTHGHVAGDYALRRVAESARRSIVRAVDTLARYGGEEFAFILPDTTLAGAATVAERIRRAIEADGIVTASLGVACATAPNDGDGPSLIARADQALYRAKAAGRNRVET